MLVAVRRPRTVSVRGEWLALLALAGGAWLLLAASEHESTAPAMEHMAGMAHGGGSGGHSVAAATGRWTLMVVAMMSTGLAPMVGYVRDRSLRRRWQAAPTVVAAYLATWVAAGIVVVPALRSVAAPSALVAGCFAVAAVWQLTPHKRWAMEACARPSVLHLRGWGASRSEVGFGVRQGAACLASCWALMLPMGFAAHPPLWAMVAATAVVTTERLARRPDLARTAGAVLLAVTSVAVAAG